jgi:hypothetical protein
MAIATGALAIMVGTTVVDLVVADRIWSALHV